MNKLILFCCAIFLFFSCQNEKANSESNSSDTKVEQATSSEVDVNMLPGKMKYLVKGIWWYDGYVSTRAEYRKEQRGKWFEFFPNGTLNFGRFQKLEGLGKWHYIEEEEKLFLTLPPDDYSYEWTIQMSKTNDLMIWKGPSTGRNKGDQAKLSKYLQRPTDDDVLQ